MMESRAMSTYRDDVERKVELSRAEDERRIAAANQNSAVARVINILYFLFGIIEVLLLTRVILKLLAANPNNSFAELIYSVSQPFVALFANLFQNPAVGAGVLELTTAIGMFVYALLAWVIGRLVWLAFSRPR
jgi:YggT family protein